LLTFLEAAVHAVRVEALFGFDADRVVILSHRVLLSGAGLLLTPPAPSTAAEGAGGLFVEGCSGDDAELRAPEDCSGVTLFGVELVHVPGIGDRAEDVTAVQQRGSHPGQAVEGMLLTATARRTAARRAD
jgi:hypothetical protein